jgi:hypothetical protein
VAVSDAATPGDARRFSSNDGNFTGTSDSAAGSKVVARLTGLVLFDFVIDATAGAWSTGRRASHMLRTLIVMRSGRRYASARPTADGGSIHRSDTSSECTSIASQTLTDHCELAPGRV